MPNIGPLELAIVLIIALVIFGPKRLPDLGKVQWWVEFGEDFGLEVTECVGVSNRYRHDTKMRGTTVPA